MTKVQTRKRDEAWVAIRPLADAQPEIFRPRVRAALIEARVAETGATRQKLYRLLRRWWQRGMSPAALTPDYANSGAPGKRRSSGRAKRGAPVLHGPAGINVDDAVREIFRDAITRYYSKTKSFDLTDCYHKCIELYFSDAIVDEPTGRQRPHYARSVPEPAPVPLLV